MMVQFRKRLNESIPAEINEIIVDSRSGGNRRDKPDDDRGGSGEAGDDGGNTRNADMLLMDASCVPADIRYPTNLSILNEVREKTENLPTAGAQGTPEDHTKRDRQTASLHPP